MEKFYGFPNQFNPPEDIDFYVLSNEDIGLNANLVAGTNDNYQFALPYPASFDLQNDSLIVHALALKLLIENEQLGQTNLIALSACLSMLAVDIAAASRGQALDTTDEFFKAQFATGLYFGQDAHNIVATASVEGTQRKGDTIVDAIYVPPVPMDLVTPMYITFFARNQTILLATNVPTDQTFSGFDLVEVVPWFTLRKLTARERDRREDQQRRWQRLDS